MSDHFDVDTSEQLIAWQLSDSPAVRAVLELLEQRGVLISSSASSGQVSGERPYLIAIDGPSGSGKSTFATALALRLSATVIEGDDFYSPRLALLDAEERDAMSDGDASAAVIDWKRLRAEALDPLLARQSVYYLPYDWEAGDGSLGRERRLPAADVIIIDGVYSFRPELADLIDLSVFVEVAAKVRKQRLDQRQDPSDWSRFWDRAERHYFTALRPPEAFDLRITSAELDNRKDS